MRNLRLPAGTLHRTYLLLLAVGTIASTANGGAGASEAGALSCTTGLTTAGCAIGCSGAGTVLFALSSKAAHGYQNL